MKNLDKLFGGAAMRMAGTEGSFRYHVRAASARGRVGVRRLGEHTLRLRLEPSSQISEQQLAKWARRLPANKGYKQPGYDGQRRFSIVVQATEAESIVEQMLDLLGRKEGLKSYTENPELATPIEESSAEEGAGDEGLLDPPELEDTLGEEQPL